MSPKKSKKPVIVCGDERSRNKGYVCVKGFSAVHARKGISQHCQRCVAESGENDA
jgi:hypothetical protein